MVEAKLLSMKEVRELLGVCDKYLRRLIHNREIAFVNIGAYSRVAYRFRQKDVDEFIERKRQWGANDPGLPSVDDAKPRRRVKKSPYEIIDFVAQRAAKNIQKPKGGWHKQKKSQDA